MRLYLGHALALAVLLTLAIASPGRAQELTLERVLLSTGGSAIWNTAPRSRATASSSWWCRSTRSTTS